MTDHYAIAEQALDILYAHGEAAAVWLASACGCDPVDIVIALDRRSLACERCAPQTGNTWWWRLTSHERLERDNRCGRPRQRRRRGAPAASPGQRADAEPARAVAHDHPHADPALRPGDGVPGAGGGLADRPARGRDSARANGGDAAHDRDPAPVHDATPSPQVADRALRLLTRRAEQGLGGAHVSWIAEQLRVAKADVHEAIARDPRFGRIAAGTDVWWWPKAAMEARG